MYTVYVLKSFKNGKQYIGYTSKPISTRMHWHELGLTAWTRQNGSFELIHKEEYASKEFARKREKFFKSGNGREVLKRLILDQNISTSAKELGACLTGRQGSATQCGGG